MGGSGCQSQIYLKSVDASSKPICEIPLFFVVICVICSVFFRTIPPIWFTFSVFFSSHFGSFLRSFHLCFKNLEQRGFLLTFSKFGVTFLCFGELFGDFEGIFWRLILFLNWAFTFAFYFGISSESWILSQGRVGEWEMSTKNFQLFSPSFLWQLLICVDFWDIGGADVVWKRILGVYIEVDVLQKGSEEV